MVMHTWKARFALGLSAALAATVAIASVGPARAAVESLFSCDSTKPCLQWNNSGNGDAIKGVSTSGAAVEGQTKFNSTGKTAGKSAVVGADVSSSGTLNSGVSGTSTNGTGVTGTSTGASGGNGVAGFSSSTSASGVYGQSSSSGVGVAGQNTSTAHNSSAAGMLANGGTANDGLHSFAGSGNAVYAFSQSGTALFANQGANTTAPELYLQDTSSSNNDFIQAVGPAGGGFELASGGELSAFSNETTVTIANNPADPFPALNVFAGTAGTNSPVLAVYDNNGNFEMGASDVGNLGISGLLFSQGSCHTGCLQGNKRVANVAEYAAVEAEPTIEDNGEATLVDGVASVTLDAQFANVIDTGASYLVSVTPEGDCRGLYVSQRGPRGFAVRELQGGHSSLDFEYRITAKPFGVHATRLAMTAERHVAVPRHRRH